VQNDSLSPSKKSLPRTIKFTPGSLGENLLVKKLVVALAVFRGFLLSLLEAHTLLVLIENSAMDQSNNFSRAPGAMGSFGENDLIYSHHKRWQE